MAFKDFAPVLTLRLPSEMPSRGATWPIRAALVAAPAREGWGGGQGERGGFLPFASETPAGEDR